LTPGGYDLLAAFLRQSGISVAAEVPGIDDERPRPSTAAPLPTAPVTF
jgi:hypothetical protein